MKKLLLFIPAGLIASAGLLWVGVDYYYDARQSTIAQQKVPLSGQELFTQSEDNLRQLIRHGNQDSIPIIKTSIDLLMIQLSDYKSKKFSTEKIEHYLSGYQKDCVQVSEKIVPYTHAVKQYDTLTQNQGQIFNTSIDQIGLYELKTSSQNLDKLSREYFKNPTDDTKKAYETESEKIKTIISELYLDGSIEKPLIDYIDNHRNYFSAISSAYNEIGYERIIRLKTTAYAIQTELQMLPSI